MYMQCVLKIRFERIDALCLECGRLVVFEIPESVFGGQRLTGMTAGQNSFPLAGSQFEFKQHGNSGAWISDLMPHISKGQR